MDTRRQDIEWPEDPYKGLAYYEARDRHLFAGREEEVAACARLLANVQTRLLILHGQTGCGKSSFLRAGLIPALEENGAGYLFLRAETPDGRWEPAFIRCGADPVAAIAEEVYRFAGQTQSVPTARGPDLVDVSAARLGAASIQAFVDLCSDPEALCLALRALAAEVPHTLVLVLDQAEELITMNRSSDNQRRFSRFVRELVASGIDIRFLIAIRKDHSGPFIGALQSDNALSLAFRTFFLNDLSLPGIREAIERPTLDELPDRPGEPGPYARYRFKYAPGVVDQIADDLDKSLPSGATLPVLQIVCRDLYNQVRRTAQPWIIQMTSYVEGGRIKGRIKHHVVASLRAILAAQAARSSRELELKWLRVLAHLVQEEGDGRVHTNAVRKETLEQWAKEECIDGAVDPVLDRLTDPRIFILRRFGVFVPGAAAEQELLCLGHDMVGIAIMAALGEADVDREVSAVRKNSTHIVAGVVLVAALLAGIGLLRLHVDMTRRINELLTLSLVSRNTDIVQALVAARDAWQRLRGSMVPVDDDGPAQTMAALLSGFPDILEGSGVTPLKPDSPLVPVYILSKGNGFARLRQDGVLDVMTVDGQGDLQAWSTPALRWPASGVDALGALDVVDLSRERLLAHFATRGQLRGGGVIGVDRNGTQRLFTEDELVATLDEPAGAADTYLRGISGSAVVLYRRDRAYNQVYPAVVEITPRLALDPDVYLSPRPALAGTEISGGYLVSFLTEGGVKPADPGAIPEPRVLRVTARDVRTATPERSWDVRDFATVRACRSARRIGHPCEVSQLPALRQPGLVVLGMWKLENTRLTRQRWTVSHLLVADTARDRPTEVDLLQVARARQRCAANGMAPDAPVAYRRRQVLDDDDVPTFVVRGPRGLLLGFASSTSAQLIDVSAPDQPCKEIYFPESQVNGWRMSEDGRRLLASTRRGGFIWNLADAVAPENGAIEQRLARICKQQPAAGAQPADEADGAERAAPERRASVRELCQEQGKAQALAPRALRANAAPATPPPAPPS